MSETTESFDTGVRPEDIDPLAPRPVETPWGTAALYRLGGEVLAADAFCPHLLGPLFQGTLSGDEITCPWHQWRYSLRTGERTDSVGDDSPPLRRYPVDLGPSGTILLAPPG